MSYKVEIIDELTPVLERSPRVVGKHMAALVTKIALQSQREIVEIMGEPRPPKGYKTNATGLTASSIQAQPARVNKGVAFATVGTSVPHGLALEEGTKPHFPPFDPIRDWVIVKLGKSGEEAEKVARKVQWKISRRGTEGKHMFRGGLKSVAPQAQKAFASSLAAALQEISG